MSAYIKGFPLPNNCGACPLRLAWCRERIYMVTRPERCPLVPVPEHGRLIDADAAVKKLKRLREYHSDDSQSGTWIAHGISHCIEVLTGKEAPTIIPADKEGKG